MEPSGSGSFRPALVTKDRAELLKCQQGAFKMTFWEARIQKGASTRIHPLDHVFVLGHQPARDLLRIVPIPAGPASFSDERGNEPGLFLEPADRRGEIPRLLGDERLPSVLHLQARQRR